MQSAVLHPPNSTSPTWPENETQTCAHCSLATSTWYSTEPPAPPPPPPTPPHPTSPPTLPPSPPSNSGFAVRVPVNPQAPTPPPPLPAPADRAPARRAAGRAAKACPVASRAARLTCMHQNGTCDQSHRKRKQQRKKEHGMHQQPEP